MYLRLYENAHAHCVQLQNIANNLNTYMQEQVWANNDITCDVEYYAAVKKTGEDLCEGIGSDFRERLLAVNSKVEKSACWTYATFCVRKKGGGNKTYTGRKTWEGWTRKQWTWSLWGMEWGEDGMDPGGSASLDMPFSPVLKFRSMFMFYIFKNIKLNQ